MKHRIVALVAAVALALAAAGGVAAKGSAGAAPYASLSYAISGTQGSHVVNVTATATSGSAGAFQNAVYALYCNNGLSGSGGRLTFRKGVATVSVYVGDQTAGGTFLPENCATFTVQLWTDGSETTPLSDVLYGTIP